MRLRQWIQYNTHTKQRVCPVIHILSRIQEHACKRGTLNAKETKHLSNLTAGSEFIIDAHPTTVPLPRLQHPHLLARTTQSLLPLSQRQPLP